jgi:hypothetical protein
VIIPLYKGEAMYMAFSGGAWVKGYPFAIKIAAGKINAISGKPWKDELGPTGDVPLLCDPRRCPAVEGDHRRPAPASAAHGR